MLSDWTTGINTAFKRGIEQNKLEVARKMAKEGFSVDIIQKITGLDIW
jgi:hypothetical protein